MALDLQLIGDFRVDDAVRGALLQVLPGSRQDDDKHELALSRPGLRVTAFDIRAVTVTDRAPVSSRSALVFTVAKDNATEFLTLALRAALAVVAETKGDLVLTFSWDVPLLARSSGALCLYRDPDTRDFWSVDGRLAYVPPNARECPQESG